MSVCVNNERCVVCVGVVTEGVTGKPGVGGWA